MTQQNIRHLIKSNLLFALTPVVQIYFSVLLILLLSRINTEIAAEFGIYLSIEFLTLAFFTGLMPVLVGRLKSGTSLNYLLIVYSLIGMFLVPFVFLLFTLYSKFIIGDSSGLLFRLLLIFTLPLFLIELSIQAKLISIQKTNRTLPISVLSGITLLCAFFFLEKASIIDTPYALAISIYISKTVSILSLSRGIFDKNSEKLVTFYRGIPSEIDFLKRGIVNSLDAIVISTTFSSVILFSAFVSPEASLATVLIVQILRSIVLPYKRMGTSLIGPLLNTADSQTQFISSAVRSMSVISIFLTLPFMAIFSYLSLGNIGIIETSIVAILIAVQILIEPFTGFYSSLVKGLNKGLNVLKETILYQWLFCLPALFVLLKIDMLSLVSIWSVMVLGRCVFAYRLWNINRKKWSNA